MQFLPRSHNVPLFLDGIINKNSKHSNNNSDALIELCPEREGERGKHPPTHPPTHTTSHPHTHTTSRRCTISQYQLLTETTLKPVLNWANVCSPNILRTVRRTMIRFLIELLVRRIWFGQSKLYFVHNWLVMRCKLRPELAAESMIENVG